MDRENGTGNDFKQMIRPAVDHRRDEDHEVGIWPFENNKRQFSMQFFGLTAIVWKHLNFPHNLFATSI